MAARDESLGAVLREESKVGLRYARVLHHPPEKVWRALTESEHLQHWFPADLVGERRAGAELRLPFWPDAVERFDVEEPVLTGTLLVWDPPRMLELTWDTDRLLWELEPVEEGTRLTLTTWLGDLSVPVADTGSGYHVCLDRLAELLDTGAVGYLEDATIAHWRQRYEEHVGASAP